MRWAKLLLMLPIAALEIAGCSLVFQAADAPVDAGPGDGDGDASVDAGGSAVWKPVIEWVTPVQEFFAAGLYEENTSGTLVGHYSGSFMWSGGQSTASGASDFAFLTLDQTTGMLSDFSAYGGKGALTVIDYNRDRNDSAYSIVGLYSGEEELCPSVGSADCSVAAPGTSTSAFASLYGAPPSATIDPATVASFSLSATATASGATTLARSSVAYDDRIIVVGSYTKSIIISVGSTNKANVTNSQQSTENLFVSSIGANGELGEALTPDLDGSQVAWAVEQAGLDNVYVVGSYVGPLKFGFAAGADELPNAAARSIFVLHSNRGLTNAIWTLPFGTGITGGPLFAAVTLEKDLLVAGTFENQLSLPNGGVLQGSATSDVVFLMKIAEDGTFRWAKRFASTGLTRVRGLEKGPSGDIFLAGDYTGTMNLDGGVRTTSSGGIDGFLLRLDSEGQARGAIDFGGTAMIAGDTQDDALSKLISVSDGSVMVSMIYKTLEQIDNTLVGEQNVIFKIH